MNIRLLRIYSVPIRISSPELHVSDTCLLHEMSIIGRYVSTTYRLHKLHVCVQGGYVYTTYPKMNFWVNDAINVWIGKFECFYSFNPCLMDLGCRLLRGSSDRRLRRCAATHTKTVEDLTENIFIFWRQGSFFIPLRNFCDFLLVFLGLFLAILFLCLQVCGSLTESLSVTVKSVTVSKTNKEISKNFRTLPKHCEVSKAVQRQFFLMFERKDIFETNFFCARC